MSEYTRRKQKEKRKNILTLAVVVAAAGVAVFCLFGRGACSAGASPLDAPTPENTARALEVIADNVPNPYDNCLDTMPSDGCLKLPVRGVGGYLAKVFNDSNKYHYAEAERLGIQPIRSDRDLRELRQPLMRIKSTPEYFVAELHHSYPYLVPIAAERLAEVGRRFNDSLQARGGGDYRLKVTSLLRTDHSVKRLRRVNRASVDSSAHRFGTTFDISYTRFMLTRKGGVHRTQEDLKNLLAEVLFAMRNEGKCFVKYERFSGCFHITARKPES